MKSRILAAAVPALLSLWLSSPALALDGEPYIHDPSTVVQCDGKFYTFGTGGGGLISDDGWTWHSGAVRPGGGAAPDVIHIGDRYYMAYASSGGGLGGGHASTIHVMWTKTLDPKSPDFGFNDNNVVASSTASRTAMPSIRRSCSIPPMAGCGSPTGPTSASSGSSSSIPRRAHASRATSPSTSPSTAKPPT